MESKGGNKLLEGTSKGKQIKKTAGVQLQNTGDPQLEPLAVTGLKTKLHSAITKAKVSKLLDPAGKPKGNIPPLSLPPKGE